jgi:hypothetical protein
MSMNCPICEGKVSFWSKVTLQDNIEICGDCKSDTNKIYSGFSSILMNLVSIRLKHYSKKRLSLENL